MTLWRMPVLWNSTSGQLCRAKIPSLVFLTHVGHPCTPPVPGSSLPPKASPDLPIVTIVLPQKKPWPEVQRFKSKSWLCASRAVGLGQVTLSLGLGALTAKYLSRNFHPRLALSKMHKLNLIVRKHQTNSNWETFHRITGLDSLKTSTSRKVEEPFQSKRDQRDVTTKCNAWSRDFLLLWRTSLEQLVKSE